MIAIKFLIVVGFIAFTAEALFELRSNIHDEEMQVFYDIMHGMYCDLRDSNSGKNYIECIELAPSFFSKQLVKACNAAGTNFRSWNFTINFRNWCDNSKSDGFRIIETYIRISAERTERLCLSKNGLCNLATKSWNCCRDVLIQFMEEEMATKSTVAY